MGTRADFYVGRGKDAEWLGSIAWDGDPSTRLPELVAVDEASYRACVEAILSKEDDATRPAQGWPWPWEDSKTTDCAYAWDAGEVWSCWFGALWLTRAQALKPGEADEHSHRDNCVFPDMTARQAVTFGKRSGLLTLGAK